jgi:hypothetical protein
MYALTPEQLKTAVKTARKHGMSTIGELAVTSYRDAAGFGLDAFVHTTRYSLDIARDEFAEAVAKEPFSDHLNSPKWRYYSFLSKLKPDNPALLKHADILGKGIPLIPTFSLLHLDMAGSENPWEDPVAKTINPADINAPANRETGKHDYDDAHLQAYAALARSVMVIETAYAEAGARYIAGSGTDVWGTMPGFSLHTELIYLKKIGLKNRQVLASCTSNPARTLKLKDVGNLVPGNAADILVLSANPLEDLGNLKRIKHLFLQGKEIDLKSLKNKR